MSRKHLASEPADIALRKNEDRYRSVVENLGDIVYVVDRNGVATYISPIVESVLGYSPSEITGQSFADFIHQEDLPRSLEGFQSALSGQATIGEYRLLNKAGEIRWVRSSNRPMFEGNRMIGVTGVLSDITERRQAEESLKESEAKYSDVVENSRDGIVVLQDGLVQFVNRISLELVGYTPEELIGVDFLKMVSPKEREVVSQRYLDRIVGKEVPNIYETVLIRKDGMELPVELNATAIDYKGRPADLVFIRDITDRKQADETLRKSEEKYRNLVENSQDSVIIVNIEGEVQFANKASEGLTGYALSEGIGMNVTEFIPPDHLEEVLMKLAEAKSGKPIPYFESAIRRKDGTVVPIETGGQAIIEDGEAVGLQIITRDITERRRAEEALRESEQKFRNLADQSPNMIFINKNGRVVYANQKCEDVTGYKKEEVCAPTFSFMTLIAPEWVDTVKLNFSRHLQGEEVPPYEYAILTRDGKRIDSLAFTKLITYEGETAILGTVVDISERKWAEEELKRSLDKLLRTSEGTIQAMAATIESRDPYTAGHQRRVAELSCAIARDMELREDQVEGIRMAAIIHDIGKIYVPAEILSKPGLLSDVEFSLIRMHPQVGYDILKDIDFPWPVADIVLGHHERLDGSGYPLGLLGGDISLEAKILGVADVVEAISSHRPYRPAIGIDKALDEISRQSGILYDPAVVDACLRLFAEKGFRFSDETTSGTSQETRNQHIITKAIS